MAAASSELKVATELNRVVFVIDLDKNLMVVAATRDPNNNTPFHLSSSATKDLDSSFLADVDLVPNYQFPMVKAFRKREWEVFFKKIADLNDRYKKLTGDSKPPITCMFLTNSIYDGDLFINNVFKRFFAEALTAKIVPTLRNRYFNRIHQQIALKEQLTESNGHTFKAMFMNFVFPKLNAELEVKKEDIILIDDGYNNCVAMRAEGFSAIYNPSSCADRPVDCTYTEHGKTVFEYAHKRLDAIEKHIDNLERMVSIAPSIDIAATASILPSSSNRVEVKSPPTATPPTIPLAIQTTTSISFSKKRIEEISQAAIDQNQIIYDQHQSAKKLKEIKDWLEELVKRKDQFLVKQGYVTSLFKKPANPEDKEGIKVRKSSKGDSTVSRLREAHSLQDLMLTAFRASQTASSDQHPLMGQFYIDIVLAVLNDDPMSAIRTPVDRLAAAPDKSKHQKINLKKFNG